ncbi:unnamed protein product, partial [Heterotrigona itama]
IAPHLQSLDFRLVNFTARSNLSYIPFASSTISQIGCGRAIYTGRSEQSTSRGTDMAMAGHTMAVGFGDRVEALVNCTLTIHKSKATENVLLLSSKQNSINIEKNRKKLPQSIAYYNNTKPARKYTVKSSSQRWPLQVFFNVIDLAGINSWILYKETIEKFQEWQSQKVQYQIQQKQDKRNDRPMTNGALLIEPAVYLVQL